MTDYTQIVGHGLPLVSALPVEHLFDMRVDLEPVQLIPTPVGTRMTFVTTIKQMIMLFRVHEIMLFRVHAHTRYVPSNDDGHGSNRFPNNDRMISEPMLMIPPICYLRANQTDEPLIRIFFMLCE